MDNYLSSLEQFDISRWQMVCQICLAEENLSLLTDHFADDVLRRILPEQNVYQNAQGKICANCVKLVSEWANLGFMIYHSGLILEVARVKALNVQMQGAATGGEPLFFNINPRVINLTGADPAASSLPQKEDATPDNRKDN